MKRINLQPVQGQEFTLNLDDVRYDIRLKSVDDGAVIYDLSIDEVPVLSGFRITAGELMIPYSYQSANGSNFYFDIPDGEVDYNEFGLSQNLYYLTADEVPSGD